MNLDVILYVLMIDFLAIMSPGPDFFMVLKSTLTDSLKAGFYTTLGITLGSSIIFALGLFGIGVILISSHIAFNIIKYVGCMYLSYLAFKSIFSKVKISEPQIVYSNGDYKIDKPQYFRTGLICNLTNPKAFLFIVSLSAYVADKGNPVIDGWFILLGSVIATLFWFTLVSFIFGRVSVRRFFYSKQRIINILFGLVLLYVASKIVFM